MNLNKKTNKQNFGFEVHQTDLSFFNPCCIHRFTIWRCLQSNLTPILARILEVLDRDANLDLAYCAGLSEGMIDLWLNILDDKQILDLTVLPTGYSTFSLKIIRYCFEKPVLD